MYLYFTRRYLFQAKNWLLISLLLGSLPNASANGEIANFTISPAQGKAPLTITLDGSDSYDPDGTIVTYEWMVDGQPISLSTETTNFSVENASVEMVDNITVTRKTMIITFNKKGAYSIGLTVTDDMGNTAQAQEIIINIDGNEQSPVAAFTAFPTEGTAPLIVTLDPSNSVDPDGMIVNYTWSVNGQPTSPATDVNNSNLRKMTFNMAGTYAIDLTVTDDDGFTDQTQKTVTIREVQSPDIRIEPTTLNFSQ